MASHLIRLSIIYCALPTELYFEYFQEQKEHYKVKTWDWYRTSYPANSNNYRSGTSPSYTGAVVSWRALVWFFPGIYERTHRTHINNNVRTFAHHYKNYMKPIKSTMYSPQEIQLANELAKGLNDQASLSFYLACTKRYSHRSLRKTLDHVLAIPKSNIRKSRGALFKPLVSQLDVLDADGFEDDEDTGY